MNRCLSMCASFTSDTLSDQDIESLPEPEIDQVHSMCFYPGCHRQRFSGALPCCSEHLPRYHSTDTADAYQYYRNIDDVGEILLPPKSYATKHL